ncbi:hypothetical protein LINPERPRIM_LOCUS35607 [Linum perenne]
MCGILSLLAGGDMEKEEGLRVLEGVRKAEDVRECRNMIKFVMDNNTWVNGKRGTRLEKNKKNDVVVRRCHSGIPSYKFWDSLKVGILSDASDVEDEDSAVFNKKSQAGRDLKLYIGERQEVPKDDVNLEEEKRQKAHLADLWESDGQLWKQTARLQWHAEGDQNSSRSQVDAITQIPICPPGMEDEWKWKFYQDKSFSVRTAYHALRKSEDPNSYLDPVDPLCKQRIWL